MTRSYRAKVFKSGNSLALRLPKALGIIEGSTMMLHEQRGRFILEPGDSAPRKVDLRGIFGSARGLTRQPPAETTRDWLAAPGDG